MMKTSQCRSTEVSGDANDSWRINLILVPKLPENLEVEEMVYGEEEIHKLISGYDVTQKSDTYDMKAKQHSKKKIWKQTNLEQNDQDSSIWCMNNTTYYTYQKTLIDIIKIIHKKSNEGKESLRLSKSQYLPSKTWVDLSIDSRRLCM